MGAWKFIPASKGPKRAAATNTELGNDPAGQLYDLAADPGETKNLAAENPEKLAALRAELERTQAAGRMPEGAGERRQ